MKVTSNHLCHILLVRSKHTEGEGIYKRVKGGGILESTHHCGEIVSVKRTEIPTVKKRTKVQLLDLATGGILPLARIASVKQ